MTKEKFIQLYGHLLFDKKNRINSHISRSKLFNDISNDLQYLTPLLEWYPFADRIHLLINDVFDFTGCEICKKPTILSNTNPIKFRPFCGYKCSRSPGSSTFTKAQQTNLDRYGVKSNLCSKEQIEKNRKKFGGLGLGSTVLKEKIINTNLLKYGHENPFQSDIIKEKIKKTSLLKYGANSYNTSLLSKEQLIILNDNIILKDIVEDDFPYYYHADRLNLNLNTLLKYIRSAGLNVYRKKCSMQEKILEDGFTKSGINYLKNYRYFFDGELKGRELDFYLPDYNMAIELQGLYWHSGDFDNIANKKLEYCNNKNIKLLIFYEDEINDKLDIILSMIKTKAGLIVNKIPAKNCDIREVISKDKIEFFNKNHLNGDVKSTKCYGLYYRNTLVQCVSITNDRFSKDSKSIELARSATKLNIIVQGGLSKLLKYILTIYDNDIISYADKRFSSAKSYNINTMKCEILQDTPPSYYYFKSSVGVKRFNRMNFQKHKLEKILKYYEPNLSANQNIENNGWLKVWNLGNYKFKIKNPN